MWGHFAPQLRAGWHYAESGKLVTFGIQPTRAETGYGYISTGRRSRAKAAAGRFSRFVEKPDTARRNVTLLPENISGIPEFS